jgi:hypothetical protein
MVTDKRPVPVEAHTEQVAQCEAITMAGSPNPDSPMFGPAEQCQNDALPGSRVCAEHGYVLDEPLPVTARPLNYDLLPANPALLVRSDGQLEVADDEHAHDRYACRAIGHEGCVLRNGHPGPMALVREYWFGPPPYEDDPNYRYYEDPKD